MNREILQKNPAFLITDVARLYRRNFDRSMRRLGLDRSHWWLLSFLVHFEGSTQRELAEVMDIGKAGLGDIIDRLETEGLVTRLADARDRRIKRIVLTEKARPLVDKIQRASANAVKTSLNGLSKVQVNTLIELLRNIQVTLESSMKLYVF